MVAARRSKRNSKTTVATRFSARQQARQQKDADIYGQDYGILPSGVCCCVVFLCVVYVCFAGADPSCGRARTLVWISLYFCLNLQQQHRLILGESLGHPRAVRLET